MMTPSADRRSENKPEADVLGQVAAKLESEAPARSLWLKLEEEMATGGVPNAIAYLRVRFKELSDRVEAALQHGGSG